MADELARALSSRIGDTDKNNALLEAMKALLILLLTETKSEEEDLVNELEERIKNKYPYPSSKANKLIPMPM